MNPKHHNPTKKRYDKDNNEFWAHAPYNFVPLPEKVVMVDAKDIPGHDIYTEHSGYIDCVLETRSPLYTRCALKPEFFKEWAERIQEMMRNPQARSEYAQFFHLEDAHVPVIPGSSLRGMVRAGGDCWLWKDAVGDRCPPLLPHCRRHGHWEILPEADDR